MQVQKFDTLLKRLRISSLSWLLHDGQITCSIVKEFKKYFLHAAVMDLTNDYFNEKVIVQTVPHVKQTSSKLL